MINLQTFPTFAHPTFSQMPARHRKEALWLRRKQHTSGDIQVIRKACGAPNGLGISDSWDM